MRLFRRRDKWKDLCVDLLITARGQDRLIHDQKALIDEAVKVVSELNNIISEFRASQRLTD